MDVLNKAVPNQLWNGCDIRAANEARRAQRVTAFYFYMPYLEKPLTHIDSVHLIMAAP